MGPKFRRIYANACYRSKLLYGIEAWGGLLKGTIAKLQAQQDMMTKMTLGKDYSRLSARQRQRLLNWLPINQEIEYAAAKTTFKIILDKKPEELASLMPINSKGLRIKNQRKLDTKPAWLTKTKVARASFRARSYNYNILPSNITTEVKFSRFKKLLKTYYLDKYFNQFSTH